jgi:fructose-1,6-bisphosphatase
MASISYSVFGCSIYIRASKRERESKKRGEYKMRIFVCFLLAEVRKIMDFGGLFCFVA